MNSKSLLRIGLATAITGGLVLSTLPAEAKTTGAALKIGTVFPITGDLESYGTSLASAASLGISQVNASIKKNKLGGSCTLVGSEDDQTNATAGVAAANTLVKSKKANVLIGSMASSVTLAIAKAVTVPNNVILISPLSSSKNITNVVDKDTVFRTFPSDLKQAKALVVSMALNLGKDATINIGSLETDFDVALVANFKKEWLANGGKIGAEVSWTSDVTSLKTQAQQLVDGSPSGWLLIDNQSTIGDLVRALTSTGKWHSESTFTTDILNSKALIASVGSKYLEGIRGVSPTFAGETQEDFQTMFEAKFPDLTFTGYEPLAYDAAVLACLASVSAKSVNTKDLIPALRKVSGPKGTKYSWKQLDAAVKAIATGKAASYVGAWSEVDFDKQGDPGLAVYDLFTVNSGEPVIMPEDKFTVQG
jgi:hypothetical protein